MDKLATHATLDPTDEETMDSPSVLLTCRQITILETQLDSFRQNLQAYVQATQAADGCKK